MLGSFSFPLRKKISNKLLAYLLKNRVNGLLLLLSFQLYKLLNLNYPYKAYYKQQKHHFIPQFLLRNFKIGENNLIYEYERGKEKATLKSIPKEAAFENDYYTTTDKQKQKSNFVEREIFSELLETTAPNIINKLKICNNIELTSLEESILASFVAFQYTRVPAFREKIKNFIIYLILVRGYKIDDLKNKEFIEKIIVRNELSISSDELIVFRKINNATVRYDISGIKNHLIGISLMIGNYIAEDVFRKNVHLIEVSEPDHFFLADQPVSIIDLRKESLEWPVAWDLKPKQIIISMPISSQRCIFYTDRVRKDGCIETGGKELVEGIKASLILNADKYLYSAIDLDSVQSQFNKTRSL